MKTIQAKNKKEYGDFQTPIDLSMLMINILKNWGLSPDIIIEPTCGVGNILIQAHNSFSSQKTIGIEINKDYCSVLSKKIKGYQNISILNDDIFTSFQYIKDTIKIDDVCLFIGNPPWVTNSELGLINGKNLPEKANIKNLRGIDAITGKSNFDISEYILIKLIEVFNTNKSIFAFLCKTTVARNVLKYCYQNNIQYFDACMFPIDSKKYFNVSVDACYFVINAARKEVKNERKLQKSESFVISTLDVTKEESISMNFKERDSSLKAVCETNRVLQTAHECVVYDSIETQVKKNKLGFYQNNLIRNIDDFLLYNYLGKSDYIWRNGLKHDCSKVMEFDICGTKLVNGYGEEVDIEDDLVYPLLKSSDIANGRIVIRKKVLVTQKRVGEDTFYIKHTYPKTWQYLYSHIDDFNKRKSSIYKNKPLFSVFSVGDYSFFPYKIAISGLYKYVNFKLIPPIDNKSVIVDDTCNFISCNTEEEASMVYSLLRNEKTELFLNSIIFWDSKRPITTEILNSVDLKKIANEKLLGTYYNMLSSCNSTTNIKNRMQMELFQ